MMVEKIESFGITDIGPVRTNNEDVWSQILSIPFFVLTDGMGGHQAGEVAAKVAVIKLCQQIDALFATQSEFTIPTLEAELKRSIEEMSAFVYELSEENEDLKGMGTTVCTLLLHRGSAVYGHVGDSRIYRFRKGILSQLTHDHSLRSQLLAKGKLDDTAAQAFPLKNVITRAIGTSPKVEAEVGSCPVEAEDIYFLCSDGLTDVVSHKELEKIIIKTPNVAEACHLLVETAKKNGGTDNITVVMIKVL